jgi:hypothetical protein
MKGDSMANVTKQIVDFLVAFLVSTLVDGYESYRDKGLSALKLLFEKHSLSLVADSTPTKGKGNKGVAHNTFDDKYIRVSAPNVNCPTLIKPVTAKKREALLGFVIVPDSDRVDSLEQLESFALHYLGKAIKRHEQFVSLCVASTARQIGEDIRNNFAGKEVRKAKQAEDQEKKIKAYANMPASAWEAYRNAVVASDDDEDMNFVELVEEYKAEHKSV